MAEDYKKQIFNELALKIKDLASSDINYGDGLITAYTLIGAKGEDVLELQTDYGDLLDLLVILDGVPYSLGGDYIHGEEAWLNFETKAMSLLDVLFKTKTATRELWLKKNKRVGGQLFIPSISDDDRFVLYDRTGKRKPLFAKTDHLDVALQL